MGRKAGPDRPPWTYSSWTVAVHLGGWGQKHYQETDHPGWDQALSTKSKAALVVLEQGGAHRAWLPQAVGRMVDERIQVKSGHKASALHPSDQACGRAVASWTVSVSLCGLISFLLLGHLLGRFPAEPSGGRGPLGPVQDEPPRVHQTWERFPTYIPERWGLQGTPSNLSPLCPDDQRGCSRVRMKVL